MAAMETLGTDTDTDTDMTVIIVTVTVTLALTVIALVSEWKNKGNFSKVSTFINADNTIYKISLCMPFVPPLCFLSSLCSLMFVMVIVVNLCNIFFQIFMGLRNGSTEIFQWHSGALLKSLKISKPTQSTTYQDVHSIVADEV